MIADALYDAADAITARAIAYKRDTDAPRHDGKLRCLYRDADALRAMAARYAEPLPETEDGPHAFNIRSDAYGSRIVQNDGLPWTDYTRDPHSLVPALLSLRERFR